MGQWFGDRLGDWLVERQGERLSEWLVEGRGEARGVKRVWGEIHLQRLNSNKGLVYELKQPSVTKRFILALFF